jgi:hypothetical protein
MENPSPTALKMLEERLMLERLRGAVLKEQADLRVERANWERDRLRAERDELQARAAKLQGLLDRRGRVQRGFTPGAVPFQADDHHQQGGKYVFAVQGEDK